MKLDGPRPATGGDGGPAVALVTLLAPISWGTTYVTITELLPTGRPLLVALLRVAPSGLALTAYGWCRHRWRPRGPQWRQIGGLALLNFGLFFPLLVVAVHRLPGGVAASMGGVQPLLVGAITWAVVGRGMRRDELAIAALAAVGVALVVVRPGAGIDPIGVLAAAAANVSFAAGVVATKRAGPPEHRLASTGWQLLLASLLIAPVALAVEGPPPPISLVNVVGSAHLALVATGAAFAIWFNGIRRLPVGAPPVLGLAAPITGAALGWVVLGEDLTWLQLLGFAVTISAIAHAATRGARDRAPGPRLVADPRTRR